MNRSYTYSYLERTVLLNSLGSAGLKDLRLAPIGPSSKVRLYYFLAYLKTPAYNNLAVDKKID